ncbi:acyl-CoA thioesterase/bile acid-CoA:amino acid N-acyltransferase family protein [Kribbella sp. NPDC051952]|uniref:acyl-CoA thioesterase/bile acid-CoA:amino acid N-acyltransferase family protein n=1 Tax=Kribbella sp. NPDC051952 TaxID=3154851 RepID=UPI00343D3E4F
MHRIRVGLLATVACLIAGGCSSGNDHAEIHVDHAETLADQAVHLTVTGLERNAKVSVGAESVDHDGKKWHSEVTVTADDQGSIDLDRAEPTGGSYQHADGMGLFWSMNPPDGDPEQQAYLPPFENGHPIEQVDVFVSTDGKRIASTALTRRWLRSGATSRTVSLATDKISGVYAAPPAGPAKHPAVLLIGGSEGGLAPQSMTELLASHGYPTLALAYFHAPGLPKDLRDIPVEYFASAARWLARQPGVDPAHIVVSGTSRGSEAALLASQNYPDLIHGTILYAPSATVIESFPAANGAAWTLHGQPLRADGQPIPVDHVTGPVLAVAGTDDLLSQAQYSARQIVRELDEAHNRLPHEALVLEGAGHAIGGAPYLPRGTTFLNPVLQRPLQLGGSRAVNEAALRQVWPKTLALLGSLS